MTVVRVSSGSRFEEKRVKLKCKVSKGVAVNTTQNTGNCESRKDEWERGGQKEAEVEAERKGHCISQPQ